MNGLSPRTVCVPLIRICLLQERSVSVVHARSNCAYGPRKSRRVLRVARRPVASSSPSSSASHAALTAHTCKRLLPLPLLSCKLFGFSEQTDEFRCHLCEFSVPCFVCRTKTILVFLFCVNDDGAW